VTKEFKRSVHLLVRLLTLPEGRKQTTNNDRRRCFYFWEGVWDSITASTVLEPLKSSHERIICESIQLKTFVEVLSANLEKYWLLGWKKLYAYNQEKFNTKAHGAPKSAGQSQLLHLLLLLIRYWQSNICDKTCTYFKFYVLVSMSPESFKMRSENLTQHVLRTWRVLMELGETVAR